MVERVQDVLDKLARTNDYSTLNESETGLLTRFLHENAAAKNNRIEDHNDYHDYDNYLVGDEPMELNKALIREDDGDYYNEVTIKYDNNVFTFNFWEIRGPLIKLDFDSLIDFRWQVEINKTENLIFDMIKELDEVNAQISKLLKRRAELTDSINGYNNSLNNIFVDSFSEEKDG
jgi:hypothetical protein